MLEPPASVQADHTASIVFFAVAVAFFATAVLRAAWRRPRHGGLPLLLIAGGLIASLTDVTYAALRDGRGGRALWQIFGGVLSLDAAFEIPDGQVGLSDPHHRPGAGLVATLARVADRRPSTGAPAPVTTDQPTGFR